MQIAWHGWCHILISIPWPTILDFSWLVGSLPNQLAKVSLFEEVFVGFFILVVENTYNKIYISV